jgi:hypothetical protein
MKHFLTYFDVNYAARGLAMIESLVSYCPEAQVTVLCLDHATRKILSAEWGDRVTTVSRTQLARYEPRLLEVCIGRTPWEYYATHKPVLLSWALDRAASDELVCFIDADTWFYSNPASLFDEARRASVAISPHRFHATTQSLAVYGRFCAGFGMWRNDFIGRSSHESWTEECLDWCYNRVDGERFMNQGYLNAWPGRFPRVALLAHPGHNLAPWNLASHRLSKGKQGVMVDSRPLVFFHFSGLTRTSAGVWQTIYTSHGLSQPLVLREIYHPYLTRLEQIRRRLMRTHDLKGMGSDRQFHCEMLTLARAA